MKHFIIYLLLLFPVITHAQDTLLIDQPIKIVGEGLRQQITDTAYYIEQKNLGNILLDEVSWTYNEETSIAGYRLITEAESVADSVRFQYRGLDSLITRVRIPTGGFVGDTLTVTTLDTITVNMKAYYGKTTYWDHYTFPHAAMFRDISNDTTESTVEPGTFGQFIKGIEDINNDTQRD